LRLIFIRFFALRLPHNALSSSSIPKAEIEKVSTNRFRYQPDKIIRLSMHYNPDAMHAFY